MAFTPRNVISDISIPAPDFGLMAKSAQAVQTRYLDGFNKAQSYYKSLLNANITSKDNEKYRAEYFKKVNTYLTNLSGVDFSNPANVKAATDLFQPLVKDKDFVTDLTWTSMQDAEKAKMEDVRTNKNEKIRSQYDPIMQKAMDYSYQDMQEAKRGDGSISKVGVQKFVPFQDIQGLLNKAATDLKLKVKIDHISGLYKITDTNGDNAYPAFLQWARQQMGNKFDEQLLVTGKVNIKDQVRALMQGDPNLSKEDAYQQVAKNNSLGIYQNFNEYKNSLNEGIETIDKKIDELKLKYKGKIAKDNPDFQIVAQLKKIKDQYQTELSGLDQSKSQDIETAFDQFMANPEYSLLPSLKDGIANGWAKSYADATKDRKIDGDKVGLQLQNQKFKEALENKKILANWNRDRQKHLDKLEEARYKASLKGGNGMIVPTGLEDKGTQDETDLWVKDQTTRLNSMEEVFLSQDVLEIATASTNLQTTFGVSYADLSKSIKNVIDNFDLYGNNPASDPQFFEDYNRALKIAKRVSPGITKITDAGQFMSILREGVNKYKGGNPEKFKRAKTAVADVLDELDAWAEDASTYNKNFNNFIKNVESGYINKEYLKKDESGRWVINWEGLNENQRADIIPKLIPNYTKYKEKTGSQVTGQAWTDVDENKFDYQVFDQVMKSTDFITDVPNATELDADKAQDLKKELAGFGGNFKQLFNPNGVTGYYFTDHGKEYLKFTVPVRVSEKGKKKVDTPSGGITFMIPKDKAFSIASTSPLFAEMVNRVFSSVKPTVDWINNGLLKSNKSFAPFPSSYSVRYGIQGGNVQLDALGGIHIEVQPLQGEPSSVPLIINNKPININDYVNNPEYISNIIEETIKKVLENYDNKRATSMKEAEASYDLAMMNDPDRYVSIDDIESEADNEEQLA